MKRILISLVLIALNFSLRAQIPISNLPNTTNPVGAYVPVARNGFNYKLIVDSIAAGKLDSVKVSNDTLYSYKRGVRTFLGVIVGGSGTDTTSLSNRINLKLNISDTTSKTWDWGDITGKPSLVGTGDTASMLSVYTRVQRFLDSLSAHTTRFNGVTSSLATKLNINDTADMRPRLVAGSNVTITGTYPNLTIAATGGGVGSQDLQDVTDLGDSTTNRIVTNDSLKAQDGYIHGALYLGDTLYNRGDSLLAFGSSITGGSGVSTQQRFSYLIAQNYGMIEANYGGGGITIDAVYTAMYKIPTKTSNRGALMFEYNINDATSSDTTTWKTKMQVIIDTAVARGWTKNKIIIVGGPFSEAAARTYLANYVRAGRTVAETNGTQFFDAYTFMQTRGGTALTADSVHPTALGHHVIYQSSKTAFLAFKKKGLVDVTGDVIARRRLFTGTPVATGSYPANAVSVNNGRVHFLENVIHGGDTTRRSNALYTMYSSSGQIGLSVNQTGTTAETLVYGGQIDIINTSNQSLRLYGNEIKVGNGDVFFSGSAGRKLLNISTNGGASAIVVNEDGNADNFRIEGDGQTHLFYTDGTNDRVGIRTSTPDSNFTVNGSVRLASTVRLSGLPTGKQAKQIYADANGTLYLGDSTVGGGGGGGTTYKIGTYNSQTSSVKGATIVSDSIYMQAFTAENPGLVPAGGSNTTYLRGDGTWQTVSGGSVMYVDTIYRKAGQDSIFYKINGGTERAIKDSVGSGGGGSPAGNFGNIQINRNGSFSSPASDSLDFESATGLSVKGDISSTGQIKVKTTGGASSPSIVMSSSTNTGLEFVGTTDGICVTINGTRHWMLGPNEIRGDNDAVIGWNNVSTGPYGGSRNVGITYGADKTVKVVDNSTNLANINLGGLQTNYAAKTTTYTIAATDYTVTGDATSGAFTITLPTAASVAGKIYVIKKTDSSGNAVTVGTTSSQTIDGATTYALATQYKYVTVQSNGSNWFIIGNN